MRINDRVRYDEENVALPDIWGTIVRPTEQEAAAKPSDGVVMVAWDDGERYWEHPSELALGVAP